MASVETLAAQIAALVEQNAQERREREAREAAWREEAATRQAAWEAAAAAREAEFRAELTRAAVEARQREETAAAEIIQLQRRLLEGAAEQTPRRAPGRRPMVDTKGLGKPPTLRADGKDWQTFQFRVENYLEAVRPGARAALTWAADQVELIDAADQELGLADTVDSPEDLDEEVYCSLAALLEGEALDILMSTARGSGLEAWRRLSRRYDGTGPAKLRSSLTAILAPERLTLRTLSAGILQWEERVRVYEQRTKEALGERVRSSVLVSLTAGHGPLKEHLDLNAGRLKGYAQIREEITMYLDGKHDSAAASLRSGPAPMDVGALGKGAGGAGPAGGCWVCGGEHYARDCPDGAPPAGKGKGKGGQKGKSKGKGKGEYRRHSWEAFGPGAPKGTKGKGKAKGLNAVEHDAAEPATGAEAAAAGWEVEHDDWYEATAAEALELGGLSETEINLLDVMEERSAGDDELKDILGIEDLDVSFIATVDSGAAGSVMPVSVCPDAETEPPTKVRYRAANGSLMPNRGVRRVKTQHGVFRFGLADVTKPLLSVGEIVAKGHDVVMRADGGYIAIRKAGRIVRRVPMKLQKGVFTLELKPAPGNGSARQKPAPGNGSARQLAAPQAAAGRQGISTQNRFAALSPIDEEDEAPEAAPFPGQA